MTCIKVSSLVFECRYLWVSPLGMAIFTLCGWYDVLRMYNCGFLTSRKPVSRNWGPLYTIVSKKVSSVSLFFIVEFDHWVDFVDLVHELKLFVCACPD